MAYKIITLGRQYGSGGREIGRQLADDLGYAFYDKELIYEVAKASGLDQKILEKNDETVKSGFFQNFTMGFYGASSVTTDLSDLTVNDKAFYEQSKVIRNIAEKENAIIVGRCADYVLSNYDYCYHVFIYGSLENRIERSVRDYNIPENKAKDFILKTDKKRASYYNYYSGKDWGDINSYHIALDSSKLGIEKCVALLKELVK